MIYKVRDGYSVRQVAGTWVAISNGNTPPTASDMIVLSDTGVFLWNLLVEGALLEDLVARATEEYEIDTETALKDIERFLADLEASNLIEK